ncbi:head GIN domain-containing protein [Rudanella lutea]|uniref:head GIN domain-containing protein n=1 Tax=Rudanella lutea TaxID=451374 RepID=UPI00039FD4E0|nr:head GIN domain-containing protein [Rudanella lutea]
MKRLFLYVLALGLFAPLFTSCIIDLGPNGVLGDYDEETTTFALSDFDRLNMGSAFIINVTQGPTFSITARGDDDAIDDLEVYTRSGTLYARYRNNRIRRHQTRFTITMPTLREVVFTGASKSDVSGFRGLSALDVDLSGASKGNFSVQADRLDVNLSGASKAQFSGNGNSLRADVSGASELESFNYSFANAVLDVSGASHVYVTATNSLDVTASGASKVRYRGNPSLQQRVTGASKVERD